MTSWNSHVVIVSTTQITYDMQLHLHPSHKSAPTVDMLSLESSSRYSTMLIKCRSPLHTCHAGSTLTIGAAGTCSAVAKRKTLHVGQVLHETRLWDQGARNINVDLSAVLSSSVEIV